MLFAPLSNPCFTAHKQIMKSEIMRINHEQQAMKEKIKVTLILIPFSLPDILH